MPRANSDAAEYLIQRGEESLAEAAKATIEESMGERMEALMHELLSLKYHDALRSFEDALKIEPENEAALEGFCYALAKSISHYEQAGLDNLADIVKVKALPYCSYKALKVAEESSRISGYFLEIIRQMFA